MSCNEKKMKYIIVSPKVYAGGPIVLHEFCRELSRQGHNAKMFYICNYVYKNKCSYWIEWLIFTIQDIKKGMRKKMDSNDSFGNCKRRIIPIVAKDTIVIYPEMVYGNMLNAKNVVRWMLSRYMYKNDPKAYGERDLFVCYRQQFNDESLNPHRIVLRTPYYNFNLYKRTNYSSRKGNCFIVYKGRDRKDLPDKYDGTVVDYLPEREKVRVFNECEYCYCYDMQSAYACIAALCGCIVIKVLEEGKKREDYCKTDDKRMFGIAFGDDQNELEFARNTLSKVKEQLESLTSGNTDSVRRFVDTCNEYFRMVNYDE